MSVEDKIHFDKIADKYERVSDSWESVYRRIREEVNPLLKGKTVLDIGNGGFFPYDTRLPKKIIVLDISPAMLSRIQEPGIMKIVSDARDLSAIKDSSMDVILFFLSIHHINGPSVKDSLATLDSILQSAFTKLKKEGILIIAEPTLPTFLFYLETFSFYLVKGLLALKKVPMIFFYSTSVLRKRVANNFGVPEDEINLTYLPIEGFVDPMGGSFPGLIKIPGWLCPTRYYLVKAVKN